MSIEVTDAVTNTIHEFPDGTSPDVIKGAMAKARGGKQESFGQEFRRTRKEQMEASDVRNFKPDLMGHPVDTALSALNTINYPFAWSGVGPLMDVATRRFIEKPVQESLPTPPEKIQQAFPWTKVVPEILGKTAGLAAQTFLPGPILARLAEIASPAKVFTKLRQGERLGEEAGKVGEAAEQVRDVKIPRAEAAGEALTGKQKLAERSLKRGEAELEQFPGKVSPKKLSPYEAGAEYGGSSIQPKTGVEELGLYGQQAKAASEHFKGRYDAVRDKLRDVKATTQDVDEIKQGVFEGMQERPDAPQGAAEYRPRPTDQPFEGAPKEYFGKVKPLMKLSTETLTQERPFGKWVQTGVRGVEEGKGSLSPGWIPREPNPVPLTVEGKTYKSLEDFMEQALGENKALSGKQILDRVQVLRDQARRSGSDLVEHLRNSLADRYMTKLNDVLNRSGQADVASELAGLNADYRKSREFYGRGAIPRLTADQYASDIIGTMFGSGKGRVERARAMRDFIPKEQFDSYVRSFHESVFDPSNMDKTRKVWEGLTPEVKAEMYGKPLATELDRIMNGIAKDESRVSKMTTASGKIEKHAGQLEKEATVLDRQKTKLAQAAKQAGYVFDPESIVGKVEEARTSKSGRAGVLGFGAYLGYEHLALGMLNLSRGKAMLGPAMFQIAKGLLYLSPAFVPSASSTVKGAKAIADVLNAASTQQQIAAGWAFRTYLSQNGSSLKKEMEKAGITRGNGPEIQNPEVR